MGKTSFKTVLFIFVLGAVAGVGLTYLGTSRQIATLKTKSDSVTKAAVVRESVTTRYTDSLRNEVVWLQNTKRPVTIKIAQDSAAARTAAEAVRRAVTASDSNVALVAQVASLEAEVAGLRTNAHTDSLSLFQAMHRGDVLQDSLHAQTQTIIGLNAQIQKLNENRLPGWARTTFAIVRTGLAVWKGVEVVTGR